MQPRIDRGEVKTRRQTALKALAAPMIGGHLRHFSLCYDRHMLTQYFEAAMAHAQYEALEDDEGYFGSIPGFPGLWASGTTVEECAVNLRSVLEGWVLVGLRQNEDLPEVEGLRLPALTPA